MKSSRWSIVLFVGLAVGFAAAVGLVQGPVEAQGVPISSPPARFQISAWGYAAGTVHRNERGCYIVDTVTGELWHALADGQPKKISEKLR